MSSDNIGTIVLIAIFVGYVIVMHLVFRAWEKEAIKEDECVEQD